MPWNKPYTPIYNQRLDLELYQSTGYITFITICAYTNLRPFTNPKLNQIIIDILQSEQARYPCAIYTYCLMPDHLHYLISPSRDGNSVIDFTNQFKGKSTNLSWKFGWHGKLWQPRFYDHIVRAEEDLRAIAEYILANPVRKGLVPSVDEWPWSGCFTPLPLGPT